MHSGSPNTGLGDVGGPGRQKGSPNTENPLTRNRGTGSLSSLLAVELGFEYWLLYFIMSITFPLTHVLWLKMREERDSTDFDTNRGVMGMLNRVRDEKGRRVSGGERDGT